MSIAKSIARKIVFPAVVKLNAEKLFSSFTEHNKLILVYHGVVDTPNHQVSLGPIAEKQFEKHLRYFQENFDVVPQEQIFEMYRDDFKPKKKTIALTFDDGYENNYHRAFPLLKKYKFPATWYIITQCLEDENRLTWYDSIDFIKTDLNVQRIDTSKLGNKKLNSIADLKEFIKTLNIESRNVLYQEIAKQVTLKDYVAKFPREYWKLMNKQQLKEMSDSGLIEIAAHSHNHPNLGLVQLEDAKVEVVKCKQLLEDVIQKEVRSLAFPDGSYTNEVKEVCRQAGYKNLLAVYYQLTSDAEDKSILPRCCIMSTTTLESNMIHIHRDFARWGF